MKTLAPLIVAALLFLGCQQENSDAIAQTDWRNLVDRGGVHYLESTGRAFTGRVTGKVTGAMKNGKWQGLVKSFYPGTGALESETPYVDGRAEGVFTFWYESGQLREQGTFAGGAPIGRLAKWHENGQLKIEATFANGKLEGLAREWDETGQLREEVTFRDGQRHGLFREWNLEEALTVERCFQNDEEVELSNCSES